MRELAIHRRRVRSVRDLHLLPARDRFRELQRERRGRLPVVPREYVRDRPAGCLHRVPGWQHLSAWIPVCVQLFLSLGLRHRVQSQRPVRLCPVRRRQILHDHLGRRQRAFDSDPDVRAVRRRVLLSGREFRAQSMQHWICMHHYWAKHAYTMHTRILLPWRQRAEPVPRRILLPGWRVLPDRLPRRRVGQPGPAGQRVRRVPARVRVRVRPRLRRVPGVQPRGVHGLVRRRVRGPLRAVRGVPRGQVPARLPGQRHGRRRALPGVPRRWLQRRGRAPVRPVPREQRAQRECNGMRVCAWLLRRPQRVHPVRRVRGRLLSFRVQRHVPRGVRAVRAVQDVVRVRRVRRLARLRRPRVLRVPQRLLHARRVLHHVPALLHLPALPVPGRLLRRQHDLQLRPVRPVPRRPDLPGMPGRGQHRRRELLRAVPGGLVQHRWVRDLLPVLPSGQRVDRGQRDVRVRAGAVRAHRLAVRPVPRRLLLPGRAPRAPVPARILGHPGRPVRPRRRVPVQLRRRCGLPGRRVLLVRGLRRVGRDGVRAVPGRGLLRVRRQPRLRPVRARRIPARRRAVRLRALRPGHLPAVGRRLRGVHGVPAGLVSGRHGRHLLPGVPARPVSVSHGLERLHGVPGRLPALCRRAFGPRLPDGRHRPVQLQRRRERRVARPARTAGRHAGRAEPGRHVDTGLGAGLPLQLRAGLATGVQLCGHDHGMPDACLHRAALLGPDRPAAAPVRLARLAHRPVRPALGVHGRRRGPGLGAHVDLQQRPVPGLRAGADQAGGGRPVRQLLRGRLLGRRGQHPVLRVRRRHVPALARRQRVRQLLRGRLPARHGRHGVPAVLAGPVLHGRRGGLGGGLPAVRGRDLPALRRRARVPALPGRALPALRGCARLPRLRGLPRQRGAAPGVLAAARQRDLCVQPGLLRQRERVLRVPGLRRGLLPRGV